MQTERSIILRLRILSDPKYISTLRAITEEIARSMGFSLDEAYDLKLALNEAVANVYEHSYEGDPTRSIFIYFVRQGASTLQIVIRDFGKQVDPESLAPRELTEFRDGGLGLFLIQSLVDDVKWEKAGSKGMRMVLTKSLKL